MNDYLVNLLQSPLKEDHRKEILHLISLADKDLIDLSDEHLIAKVANIAASYVSSATAEVSKEGTWEAMLTTTFLSEELTRILKSPVIPHYTKAVLLVAAAILKGDK